MAILNNPLQFIASVPPAARALTGILFASSVVYLLTTHYYPEYYSYFLLVPGLTLWHPWTLITASFVEVGIIDFAVSMVVLPLSLRYLERLWGAFETVKFVLITVGVSNVIAVAVNIIEHFVIGFDGKFLYDKSMSYYGLEALQVGVLVALTQAIPEHQVLLFGVLSIRVKRLPMLYVTFSNIMCILGYQSPYILIQFGWLVSWAYLRFYQRIGEGRTWGDRSETFAFVHWFPPLLNKPVTFISNVAYTAATRVGVVKAYPATDDDLESGLYNGGYAALPGGARAEAERRRALALKALDQRLSKGAAAAPKKPSTSGASTSAVTEPNSPGVASGGSTVGVVPTVTVVDVGGAEEGTKS